MVTFSDQANAYLAWLKARNTPAKATSIATIQSLLSCHATPYIGELPLAGIDNQTMRELVSKIVQRGSISPNSIALVVKFVKRVIANAKDDRGNQLYPRAWNHEHIDVPKRIKRNQPTTSREKIESCLWAAQPTIYELLATLAATGMRKGESLFLKVDDFDSRNGVLHIHGTRSRFGESSPKTEDGERQIDLHPDIAAMLRRMVGARTAGYLFELEAGRGMTDDELRWWFGKMGIKPHSLRRFRITWLRRQGCNEDMLRLWIGHAEGVRKKTVTDEYSFLREDLEFRQRLVREVGLGFTLPAVAAPHRSAPQRQEAVAAVSA
jgi:integrase